MRMILLYMFTGTKNDGRSIILTTFTLNDDHYHPLLLATKPDRRVNGYRGCVLKDRWIRFVSKEDRLHL